MKPKDFQQATANRIVEVFKNSQNRVLLADEVGLGKTIIAKEVIRQVSDWHRHEKNDDWFKVIYICSNLSIASQNAKKLGIKDVMNVSESRLTMQHLKIYQNKKSKDSYEQLIPLTPATSFTMTSGCGNQIERSLMYAFLRRLPEFISYEKELSKFLSYGAIMNWDYYIQRYEGMVKDCDENDNNYISDMTLELHKALNKEKYLASKILLRLKSKDSTNLSENRSLINKLRLIFAQISLDMLDPDLVIMDEFQRFRDLIIEPDGEQQMLNKRFLYNTNIKVLLLSATPYKPYSTLGEIVEGEEIGHYEEFIKVMEFLFYKDVVHKRFKEIWKNYSGALQEISNDNLTVLMARKKDAETILYRGMCRTERFNRGIINDDDACEIPLTEGDIVSYSMMQLLLDEINNKRKLRYRNVPIDYIKSSPYLLSFMDSYQLKKQIAKYFVESEDDALLKGLKGKYLLIKKSAIHNYKTIASNNARLEKLKEVVFGFGKRGNEAEKLLWIPPSKTYYGTKSVFDKNKNYSKVLVFSSWEMVPRMISIMLSYESEQLTIGKLFNNIRKKRGRGYFATKEEQRYGIGRLKYETEDLVCSTSEFLANLYSPYDYMGMDIVDIRKELSIKIKPEIDRIKNEFNITTSRTAGAKALIELIRALDKDETAEPAAIPVDATETLVNMAIGSPAICALRMLKGDKEQAKKLAKEVFVSLFNKAESSAILDLLYSRKGEDYYKTVFRYCVDGNLQAMLDEYAYLLSEGCDNVVDDMISAFIDTASLQIDSYESFTGLHKNKMRMRTHLAVGYFNANISDENILRTGKIRMAFNSPFRPFVLATTSIGQEGLDFHLYCRKVMHWNLPGNPIDIEQREGRVNRYKCLAVRQNIANKYHDGRNWEDMFEKARKEEKGDFSDLIPYWCLAKADPEAVKIERIVPMYPLSRDRLKYKKLIRILSLYRLTLGQPRQEELLEILNREIKEINTEDLFIDLSPYNKSQANKTACIAVTKV